MKVITELKDFQKETIYKMIQNESLYDGGMLLNEAGLGKSICVLGLIANSGLKTLIICPAGLVDNWVNEIKKHTDIDENDIVRFYGSKRKKLNTQGKNIWITSYTSLSSDILLLLKENFERIVLDEAHYIRNYRTNISKKVFELSESNVGSKKWIVTATPIYNGCKDAYAYFKFLNYVNNRADWRMQVGKEIESVKKINELIKKYSICYKKVDVLNDELLPKNEIDIVLEFSDEEKEFYDALKEYSCVRLKRLISRVKNINNDITMRRIFQMSVLTHILRLKQACNSPRLVFSKINRLKGVSSINEASKMLKYYNESKNIEEECPICLDAKANCIADPCGHKYCNLCWEKLQKHNIYKCPSCREFINNVELINSVDINEELNEDIKGLDSLDSVKISKICELVRSIIKKGDKVVIVSQWVQMLNLIKENALFDEIKYITLQGNRSIEERTSSINIFEKDDSVKVCFLSMTSSAEGINLVAANHLILVDSWWNQSQMIQVMNRIHRIGQIKNVNIYKLQVKDSIEEKIKKMINKKFNITKNILEKYDEEKIVMIFEENTTLLEKN
jgi:SNF2 family DNA or RNA helicase